MMEFFQGIGNFFNTLFSNWQGLLIGFALAGIIVLILALTAFKQNSFALKFFGTILVLALSIGGAFLQSGIFNINGGDLPTTEYLSNISKEAAVNKYTNTNGFSIAQVNAAQNDDACPIAEDEYINLTIQDFGDYVCFYYSDTIPVSSVVSIYENVTFIKSENGLIFDGMLNAKGYFEVIPHSLFSFEIDYNNFIWKLEKLKKPYLHWTYLNGSVFSIDYLNLLSLSSSSINFLDYVYNIFHYDTSKLNHNALCESAMFVGENLSQYHLSWNDNIELTGIKDTVDYDVNTFYTYLYNAVKDEKYDTTKMVDGNGYICKVIPEEERINYPVSEKFKAENPDIDYYSVYRCNLGINLTYVKGNHTISADNERQKEYIEENKENIGETIVPTNVYSLLCNFNDISTKEYTTTPNLINNPIQIIFSNEDLNHTLTITSFEDLSNANQVLLKANGAWNYLIKSDRVVFKNTSGSFVISDTKSKIVFDFEYYDDFVPYTISLSPVSSVDLSGLDLSVTPVKIILLNDTNQFIFTFDTAEELANGITQDVKLGEYNYTIVSDALSFDPLNGNISVTTTSTEYIFNYEYSSTVDLELSLSVTNNESAADTLFISATSITAIKNAMTIADDFKVEINIYSYKNELVNTIEYDYTGTTEIYSSLLVLGLKVDTPYQFQIKVIDNNNPNVIYASNVASGTQTLSYGLNLILEVSEI